MGGAPKRKQIVKPTRNHGVEKTASQRGSKRVQRRPQRSECIPGKTCQGRRAPQGKKKKGTERTTWEWSPEDGKRNFKRSPLKDDPGKKGKKNKSKRKTAANGHLRSAGPDVGNFAWKEGGGIQQLQKGEFGWGQKKKSRNTSSSRPAAR